MIQFRSGDIFQSEADALVNTVNCVGVMGRGLALQFKKKFPQNFEEYKRACDRGEVMPGRMFITERNALTTPRYIVNFPTKRHWKGKSRIEDIKSGLGVLSDEIRERQIGSIAIPALGSDLGGLHWPDVRHLIECALSDSNAKIIVYEPHNAPAERGISRTVEPPKMTTERATLVALMDRFLLGLLDPFVTPLELHKMMYFMRAAGEPLRLEFEKRDFGPYAKNLRYVLSAIEGYFISGYTDGGDNRHKHIELVPGAVDDAEALLREHPNAKVRLERVCDLMDGFESPFGMELLAKVHWLLHEEDVTDIDQVVERFHAWNFHKRQFTTRQIRLAFRRIVECGWSAGQATVT